MRRSLPSQRRVAGLSRMRAMTNIDACVTNEETQGADLSEGSGVRPRVIENKDCQSKAGNGASVTALWSAGMQAIDCLGMGLAICDPATTVLFLNGTAERIVRERDVLRLSDSWQLDTVASDAPSLTSLFERLTHSLASNKDASHALVTVIARASGNRGLTLVVRRVEKMGTSEGDIQFMMLLLDASHAVDSRHSDLHQLYGFTRTETRLANLLMSGKGAAECCAELRISISTGCSHMRNMFKKARVHRQAELVAVLLRSIGLVRFRSALKAIADCGFAGDDVLSGKSRPVWPLSSKGT
jgi:DNA-binding CsgD family transcriptional regulator